MKQNLTWKVLYYNNNKNSIEEYDVLKYQVELIKQLKKKCKGDRATFDEMLNLKMMCRYWSRCEYELLLEVKNNEVYVKPWIGCSNPEEVRVCVSNNDLLEWKSFALQDAMHYYKDGTCKFDIYDQLKFKWKEFVDYCWNTRLPYERRTTK